MENGAPKHGGAMQVPQFTVTLLPNGKQVDVQVNNCSAADCLALWELARPALVEAAARAMEQKIGRVAVPNGAQRAAFGRG